MKNVILAATLLAASVAQASTFDPLQPHSMVGAVNVIDTKNNRLMTIQYNRTFADLASCNQAIGVIVAQNATVRSAATNAQTAVFDKVTHLVCLPELFTFE